MRWCTKHAAYTAIHYVTLAKMHLGEPLTKYRISLAPFITVTGNSATAQRPSEFSGSLIHCLEKSWENQSHKSPDWKIQSLFLQWAQRSQKSEMHFPESELWIWVWYSSDMCMTNRLMVAIVTSSYQTYCRCSGLQVAQAVSRNIQMLKMSHIHSYGWLACSVCYSYLNNC